MSTGSSTYAPRRGQPSAPDEERTMLAGLLFPHLEPSQWPQARLTRLLSRGGLARLLEQPPTRSLSSSERATLQAAAEVARRFQPRCQVAGVSITGPLQALAHVQDLRQARREMLVGLMLDVRNRLLDRELVAVGGLNTAAVDPRDIFAPALRCSANAVVLAHNHPSGDPSPSAADIGTTRRIREAGQLLGIELLDHLVVSRDGFTSLREAGLM